MRLSEVLDRIEGIQIRGNIETEITEIKCDSRLVNEGDMFVAIVGYKTDGHVYVESALQKGARVIAVLPVGFAIWYWSIFLNKCGYVTHHFNAHFSLYVFLLMTYYLLFFKYLF